MTLQEHGPFSGVSQDDIDRWPTLKKRKFDLFRMGNYCPNCEWERTDPHAIYSDGCPQCRHSFEHSSAVAPGQPQPQAPDWSQP